MLSLSQLQIIIKPLKGLVKTIDYVFAKYRRIQFSEEHNQLSRVRVLLKFELSNLRPKVNQSCVGYSGSAVLGRLFLLDLFEEIVECLKILGLEQKRTQIALQIIHLLDRQQLVFLFDFGEGEHQGGYQHNQGSPHGSKLIQRVTILIALEDTQHLTERSVIFEHLRYCNYQFSESYQQTEDKNGAYFLQNTEFHSDVALNPHTCQQQHLPYNLLDQGTNEEYVAVFSVSVDWRRVLFWEDYWWYRSQDKEYEHQKYQIPLMFKQSEHPVRPHIVLQVVGIVYTKCTHYVNECPHRLESAVKNAKHLTSFLSSEEVINQNLDGVEHQLYSQYQQQHYTQHGRTFLQREIILKSDPPHHQPQHAIDNCNSKQSTADESDLKVGALVNEGFGSTELTHLGYNQISTRLNIIIRTLLLQNVQSAVVQTPASKQPYKYFKAQQIMEPSIKMSDLVSKKLSKLKQIAKKHCKDSVKEELGKVDAKQFRDLGQLTEWFTGRLPKEDAKFKQQFLRYQSQLNNWVEAYKYLKPDQSPDYVQIHDILLELYDRVGFVSDDVMVADQIALKFYNRYKEPKMRQLLTALQAKKKELAEKRLAATKQPANPPQTQPKAIPVPTVTDPTPKLTKLHQKPQPSPTPSQTIQPAARSKSSQAIQPPVPATRVTSVPQPKIKTDEDREKKQQEQRMQEQKRQTQKRQQERRQDQKRLQQKRLQQKREQERKQQEKRREEQQLKKRPVITKMPYVKQVKTHDQLKALSNLLMQRKDLEFVDSDAKRQVIHLLISQLNNYMKNMLVRLVRLAKIHNPSNNRYGDEFKYYSKANQSNLEFNQSINQKVRHSFYKIKFPDKMSIYLELRNTQERQQQRLRVEDTKKRKQNEREIMQFVRGQPRALKSRNFNDESTVSDKLTIKLTMVQALLQTDPIYVDSELLARSYLAT